eukprot:scaffold163102_cov48-Prasinocladus_malaysianus.AAC.1
MKAGQGVDGELSPIRTSRYASRSPAAHKQRHKRCEWSGQPLRPNGVTAALFTWSRGSRQLL